MQPAVRAFTFFIVSAYAIGLFAVSIHPTSAGSTQVRVKYDQTNPTPPAEFVPLTQNDLQSITEPQSCLDASGKQAFATDAQPFITAWDTQAKCAKSLAQATALIEQITDLKKNVETLGNFIGSAEQSLRENIGEDPEAAVYIVPAGAPIMKEYRDIGSVGVVCIKGDTNLPAAAISSPSGFMNLAFSETSPEIEAAIEKLRKENGEIWERRQKVVEALQQAEHPPEEALKEMKANKELKKYLDSAKKDLKKVLDSINKEALERLAAFKDTGESVMPVTSGALARWHRLATLHNSVINVTAKLDRDKKGKVEKVNFLYNPLIKTFLSAYGVKGDVYFGTFIIDGKSYPMESPYNLVPQQYFQEFMRKILTDKLADFRAKKAQYEAELQKAQQQLAALEAIQYGCATTAAPAATTHATTPSSLAPRINDLRGHVQTLQAQRDSLAKSLLEKRRQKPPTNTLPVPTPAQPLLNAAPLRQQLGNISEALESILKALQETTR